MQKQPEPLVCKCAKCNGTGFVRKTVMTKNGKDRWEAVLVGCSICFGTGILKTDLNDPQWVPHPPRKDNRDE